MRESSQLVCAGAMSPQFSYDLTRWFDVFGEDVTRRFAARYTSVELYGLKTEADLRSPAGLKIRADCDMLGLMTKSAPPLFINVTLDAGEIKDSNHLLHSPQHAKLLYDRCRELGVPVVANIPALGIAPAPDGPTTWHDFLFKQLGVKPAVDP